MPLSLLSYISITAWSLYMGPMIAFTVIFILHSQIKSLSLKALVDCFQLWGAGFGLSLGALIFSLLILRWQHYGEFTLYWSQPNDQIQSAAIGLAFLAWISNIILEIWTLDPLRKANQDEDMSSYLRSFVKLRSHMILHCFLWMVSSGLFITSLAH